MSKDKQRWQSRRRWKRVLRWLSVALTVVRIADCVLTVWPRWTGAVERMGAAHELTQKDKATASGALTPGTVTNPQNLPASQPRPCHL
jgi:hypothetical protein